MTLSDLIGLAEKAIAEYEAQYTKTRTCTIMPRDSNKSLVVHIDGMKQIQLSPEVVTALAKAAMALHNLANLIAWGWITPENETEEFQRGWDAACEEFQKCCSQTEARAALSALRAAGIEQE